MNRNKDRSRYRLPLILGTALVGTMMSVSAFAGKSDPSGVDARINQLNVQADQLSQSLFELQRGIGAGYTTTPIPRIKVGQSQQIGAVNVRLDQIEERMRTLNGQMEGLQFQITQMQTLLERMQEDYEFRFQDLEGGASGKTSAAPQSDSVTLSERLPQTQDNSNDLPATALSLGDLSTDPNGQPLDLSFSSTAIVDNADADAQYEAGYEAVLRGDYLFAKDQFSQFVGLYPQHRLTADAYHWYGEALMQNGELEEAAEVFFDGYENFPNASRAPDMVFKLGVVLARSGERETACRTFVEVLRKYPDQPSSFKTRVKAEQRTSQC